MRNSVRTINVTIGKDRVEWGRDCEQLLSIEEKTATMSFLKDSPRFKPQPEFIVTR